MRDLHGYDLNRGYELSWHSSVVAAMLLLAAGCGSKEPAVTATTAVAATVEPVAMATGAATPAAAPVATSAARSKANMSVYIGTYPLDKVGAHAFFDDPVVVSGVAAAVTDPKAAAAIAAMKGPVGPVKRVGDEIAASRCELHNCGARNYAVHVDAATNRVSSVCYYDEKAGPIATWYRPDGTKTSEGGGCSIG
ncbi:hypothetical protein EDF56_104537 [Novosphingobium sp. PhB165]|uniref:hypothetical protein n=1 Tax=Novosphingobium sp. PhB165 TaxID=2485105 RepID=UPI0010523FAA|nr:hypothetical protein [Novosphingobium sp. PhB165]TCM19002.1 hypothetical protein EDF56_104537 [Novosphingobium sp. PhB165]